MANDKDELLQATSEAEEALVVALLLLGSGNYPERRTAMDEVLKVVNPDDLRFHGLMFQAMVDTHLSGAPANPVSITQFLSQNNRLWDGCCAEMTRLISECYVSPYDYLYYAQAVKVYSEHRQGITGKPKFKDNI